MGIGVEYVLNMILECRFVVLTGWKGGGREEALGFAHGGSGQCGSLAE